MKINERMMTAVVDAHEFEPVCESTKGNRRGDRITCARPACWVYVPLRDRCHCGAQYRTAFYCEPCRAALCATPVVACGMCRCRMANASLFRFEPIGGSS